MLPRAVAFLLAVMGGVLCPVPARGTTLSCSYASLQPNSIVNLTTNGPLDWVHWGLYNESSVNQKFGVRPQISTFTPLAAPGTDSFVVVYQVLDVAHGYSWTEGKPEREVNETHTGVWAYGWPLVGTGFELTVPADATMRTLSVYLGLHAGRGRMEATLSDGSAPAYVNSTLLSRTENTNRLYTFHYAAASEEQTLRIRWTLLEEYSPVANVTLHAATLSDDSGNNPPGVLLTHPLNKATFPSGAAISLDATAGDFDGAVSNVAFFVDGYPISQDPTSPYSASWIPPTPGRYQLTAEATDNHAATGSSQPVEVIVHGTSGGLAGVVERPPPQVDLTIEGSADWVHWGLTGTNLNRKSGVGQQISDFTKIGSRAVMQYSNNWTRYSWSDGVPVPAATDSPTGVFLFGQDSGFALTMPADLTPRRLKLYVGAYGARASLQAWLSDFSAPPYMDSSVSNVLGSSYAVYTLDYAAASTGRSLMIRYEADTLFDVEYGNVTLQAATLSVSSSPPPLAIATPVLSASGFTFSFPTEAGKNYSAQRSGSLDNPSNWQTFTNVTGNGSKATVTDPVPSSKPRFYRVRQP